MFAEFVGLDEGGGGRGRKDGRQKMQEVEWLVGSQSEGAGAFRGCALHKRQPRLHRGLLRERYYRIRKGCQWLSVRAFVKRFHPCANESWHLGQRCNLSMPGFISLLEKYCYFLIFRTSYQFSLIELTRNPYIFSKLTMGPSMQPDTGRPSYMNIPEIGSQQTYHPRFADVSE